MKLDVAERDKVICYQLNGITYVPHYRNKDIFVCPGYARQVFNTYSHNDLAEAGAKKIEKMLWKRGEYGLVNERFL